MYTVPSPTDASTPRRIPAPRVRRRRRARTARPVLWALTGATLASLGCAGAQVRYRPLAADPGPVEEVEVALYLIGDGGKAGAGRDSVLAHVRRDVAATRARSPDARALVLFLGDNIYEVGARPDFRSVDLEHLTVQSAVLGDDPRAGAVFLPGNHDWARGAPHREARAAIRVQQAWLEEAFPEGRARLLPSDACPGPETLDPSPSVHVVLIDTEWLLRRPDDDCGGVDAFHERLRSDLAAHADKRVVIAAHHPMATGGPHGGNVGLFENGPFVYYLLKKTGSSEQDLGSERYDAMLEGLRAAIAASGTRPLAYASGHDHNLQVIRMTAEGAPLYQLVSGSASKRRRAARVDGTRYASDAHGYVKLDITERAVTATVFGQSGDASLRPVFRCRLGEDEAGCPEAERWAGR